MKKLSILLLFAFAICYSQDNCIKIQHSYYTSYYDTILKIPIQTTYSYTLRNQSNDYKRTQFTLDKDVPRRFQLTTNINSKLYDKGHLSPNDDFRFDSIAQKESMYYTNQCPQVKELNRGVWKGIENYVRLKGQYIDPKDSLIVKTGVISTNRIPEFFWKCIFYKNNKECFLCPNNKLSLHSKVITNYRIPYDSLILKVKMR